MPPFNGMPYGPAPAYCFPLTEVCMYVLFVLCFLHALKQGVTQMGYLLGGLAFGLLLEYVNVISNMGYTYGKFMVMFGTAPLDIPLCIGMGWGVIMYTAWLFTNALHLPLWASAALDTLLAISIDVSMDTVAYRLHMWHWDWSDTNLNPLTADWFGIPYGNFFGWVCVVFFYSSFTRLLLLWSGRKHKKNARLLALVPVASVILSQVLLYVTLVYIDTFLHDRFGITAQHRFITAVFLLFFAVAYGWKRRTAAISAMPFITWLVPLWFHVYFFIWLLTGAFYKENGWMPVVAITNVAVCIIVHTIVTKKNNALQLQQA